MSFYSDSSLVVIPSGYKTSKVYSAVPTDGTGDLTFTRSNDTATRVNSAGLIEKVRTNLILQSNTFSTTWAGSGSSVTGGQSGYDGTSNAWLLTRTGASGFLSQNLVQSTPGVVSVYAKANANSWFRIRVSPAASSSAFYNLSNGTLGTVTSGQTATITSIGNGWYRCTLTYPPTSSDVRLYVADADGDISGSSGSVFIQSAQWELGDIATPYIPTTTAAVSVGPVANVPRLDYLNSSCPRLLLEPSRTNIFPKSESSDTWSFTNMTRTGNHGIAPDGYQSADLLAPTTSGAVIFTSDSTTSSLTIGQPFVCSFFIKLNQSFNSNSGQNIIDIRLAGAAIWTRPTVRVNLVTGSVTAIQNASYLSSTNYGNGWFRITFGGIPTDTSAITQLQIPTGTTMDGGSFYIWGLQGEANATYATSYIPTLGAAVTRGADSCSKTGISSLIGQTEGTLYAEANIRADKDSVRALQASDGTVNNRIQLAFIGNNFSPAIVTGGVVQAGITVPFTAGNNKFAIAYANNDVVAYLNGVQVLVDNSATIPTCSVLDVGQSLTADTNTLGDPISQALVFKTRLTNAQLAELTTL